MGTAEASSESRVPGDRAWSAATALIHSSELSLGGKDITKNQSSKEAWDPGLANSKSLGGRGRRTGLRTTAKPSQN